MVVFEVKMRRSMRDSMVLVVFHVVKIDVVTPPGGVFNYTFCV